MTHFLEKFKKRRFIHISVIYSAPRLYRLQRYNKRVDENKEMNKGNRSLISRQGSGISEWEILRTRDVYRTNREWKKLCVDSKHVNQSNVMLGRSVWN